LQKSLKESTIYSDEDKPKDLESFRKNKRGAANSARKREKKPDNPESKEAMKNYLDSGPELGDEEH
jgi:hypothetical protein